MADRTLSQGLKAALDFGPLLLFFLAFTLLKERSFVLGGQSYSGFVAATALFIPLQAAATFALWRLTGRLSAMQVATLVLVVIFGGLSVWLNDPRFFKMKPTLIYLIFAGLLGLGLLLRRPWLTLVMGETIPMRPEGWTILTRRLALFFLGLAIANEIVWRNFSESTWVTFKTFGLTALIVVFFLSQARLLAAYAIEPPK